MLAKCWCRCAQLQRGFARSPGQAGMRLPPDMISFHPLQIVPGNQLRIIQQICSIVQYGGDHAGLLKLVHQRGRVLALSPLRQGRFDPVALFQTFACTELLERLEIRRLFAQVFPRFVVSNLNHNPAVISHAGINPVRHVFSVSVSGALR